jgi:hypothetical protein
MAEFAQFVAVTASDDAFILPDPQTGDIDTTFPNIDLDNLDRTRTAVAMFKVGHEGQAQLQMRLNSGNEHFIDFTSGSAPIRTWHEIFPGEDLQVSNNQLTISVTSLATPFGGKGRVRLSDIVILYHAIAP